MMSVCIYFTLAFITLQDSDDLVRITRAKGFDPARCLFFNGYHYRLKRARKVIQEREVKREMLEHLVTVAFVYR